MSFLQHSPLSLHGPDPKRRIRTPSVTKPDEFTAARSSSDPSLLSPLVGLLRNPVGAVGGLSERLWDGLTSEDKKRTRRVERRKQTVYAQLANSETYDGWRSAAEELDVLEGFEAWKFERESTEYDVELVEARLRQLDEARLSGDVDRMLLLIRTSLTRGLGDMGNIRLYKHSHIGTKNLIERYINSALEVLDTMLSLSSRASYKALDTKYMLEQVLSARQAFGRSALLLSGGATFGMNHIGVLKALWEARLLPRIVSGASAGSIVCAVLCTHTDEEIPELLEAFPYGDLTAFGLNDDDDGVLKRLARLLKRGALIDISHLMRVMKELVGDITFQEAYNRTRRILNICVSSADIYELPRLLNYVTAPNVLIWSAVAASCSVPFLFTAATILTKDPKTGVAVPWNPCPQRWIDGSVDNDLPMTRLAEMFNVNHFIVSQVNPHVIPFLAKEEEFIALEAQSSTSNSSSGPGWVHTIMGLAKAEAMHRMQVLAELGVFPNALTKARSVLSQKYSGDITIFPEISYSDFPRMLKNPTTEFILQAMLSGERATWSKLSRIRNHCAIELALDDAVQRLRARVVFSPSQVDLRLNAFTGMAGTAPASAAKESDIANGRERRTRRGVFRASEVDSYASRRPRLGEETSPEPTKAHRRPVPKPLSLSLTLPNPPHHSSFASSSSPTASSSSRSPSPSHSSPSADASPIDSSSPSSPSSPSYFPSSTVSTTPKSAKTRHLFPHASQPCTPLLGVGGLTRRNSRSRSRGRTSDSRRRYRWHLSSPSPPSPSADDHRARSRSPLASSLAANQASSSCLAGDKRIQAGLAMTSSEEPEARSKRLFHGRP